MILILRFFVGWAPDQRIYTFCLCCPQWSTLAAGLAIEVLYLALQPIVCFSCREKINYDRYVDLNIPEAARLVHSDLGIS